MTTTGHMIMFMNNYIDGDLSKQIGIIIIMLDGGMNIEKVLLLMFG